MLNHDEEAILKILLRIYKEQRTPKISGTFSDFPVKYQIVFKEIIERMETNDYISDFQVSIADDFVLTLLPAALNYFENKKAVPLQPEDEGPKKEHHKKTSAQVQVQAHEQTNSPSRAIKVLEELDNLIELNGGDDTEALREILAEITEFCTNLKNAPTVQPRKVLMKKVISYSEKFPWLIEKIGKALGITMLEIMADL